MAGSDAFYQAYVEVIPTAKGFERSLSGQMSGPSAVAGGVAGGAAGKGFVAGFGKMLPLIGGVLAAAGIGNIIGDAIENGSTNQQVRGAVEQVYGELGAAAINAFAEGAAKNVGQSMNDVLRSSSLIGIFGKAAGLAGDELVGFSTNLITLGADLSAFANTSPEEAVEALSAGLRGESEPLRKYGVLLDDATLKSRAMALGIYDGNGPLTQQQRILSAYHEILAQTTDQQGQFGRESDTLAGKQARVGAAFEDISTRIGVAFLPVAEKLVGFVEKILIPVLDRLADWLNDPENQEGIAQFATSLGDFIDKLVIGARQIDDFLGIMGEKFGTGAEQISAFFTETGKRFELGAQQWQGFFNLVGDGLQGFADKLAYGQSQVFDFFAQVGQKFSYGAQQWGEFFTAVGNFLQEFSDRLVIGQNQVFGFFQSIGERFALGGQQIASFAGDVGRNIGEVVNWFGQLPARIGVAVAGAGSWLVQTGRDLISGLVNGIKGASDAVFKAITGVVTGAIDWAKDLLGIASPSKVFAEIGGYVAEGFARGIESDYASVRSATSGMTSAAVNSVDPGAGAGFTNNGTIQVTDERALVEWVETKKRRALAGAF